MKYGPTKGELNFRIAFSLAGLVFVGFAQWWRGLPTGPAGFEAIVIASIFFLGTLVWSLMRLRDAGNDGQD